MIFDARHLARAWLSVALASGTKDSLPAMARTVHIEEDRHGVRLVATDSYVLLTSWVPASDSELEDEPGIDQVPLVTATAIDPHGRAKGFMAHALRLAVRAAKDNLDPVHLRLRLKVPGVQGDDRPQGLPGMEAHTVTVEQPDVERLILDSYEGVWPNWRTVLGSHRPIEAKVLALNPELVGRVSKVGDIHPASQLGLTFGGDNRPVKVQVLYAEPAVDGLVMPCRWDFSTDGPWVDQTPDEDDDGIEVELPDIPDIVDGNEGEGG